MRNWDQQYDDLMQVQAGIYTDSPDLPNLIFKCVKYSVTPLVCALRNHACVSMVSKIVVADITGARAYQLSVITL
ncbi:MAG: hypothetical protein KGM99_10050, partial [Burkholderiales bacterium]|nr:hypothetical protein [Burkholderiales bacterium]